MKNKIKISTLLIILLLTLILHLLFLYFFTTIPFASAPDKISEFIQSLLNKSESIPDQHLQAHAPQPSAPVIFKDPSTLDEPEMPPQPKPEPFSEPKTLVSHATGPQDIPKKIESSYAKASEDRSQQTPIMKKPEPKQKIEKKEEAAESAQEEEITKETTFPESQKQNQNKQQLDPLVLADLDEEIMKNTDKPVASAKNQEPKIDHTTAEKKKIKTTQIKSPSSTKNNQKSKSISLADLSQQYMQKISASIDAAEGYGSLRVEGNQQYGHPSAYQIALERYVTKMCKEIETAYRISTTQSLRTTHHQPFDLMVEVNENGSLNTVYPYPSSGSLRIDEFAKSVFQSASKSFPKLPSALGQNLRIRFGVGHIDQLGDLSQGILQSR